MNIYPAILTDSLPTLVAQVAAVKDHPEVNRVHIDIIDGQFAEFLTVSPLDLTVVEFDQLGVDLHLMVEEPMDSVFECEAVHQFLPIKRVIGQVERMSHQADFLHQVHRNGWEAWLGVDLFTDVETIDADAWPELDGVLLMGVEAGQQQSSFNPYVFQQLTAVRQQHPRAAKLPVLLDGGVKVTNLRQILAQGVDHVAVGSALWQSTQPLAVIDQLLEVAAKQPVKKS